MATNNDISKQATALTSKLEKAVAGMTSSWPSAQTSLVVLAVTYTPAQFLALLQQIAAPFQAVIAARIALQTALSVRNAALPNASSIVDAFYAVLPQYLPAGSAAVESFGSKPKKARTPLTVEQKQAAAVKRAATRAARHIMGKNQRKAILAPAPAAAPAAAVIAPAAAAAPATAAVKTAS
jgi:hypothetical protein